MLLHRMLHGAAPGSITEPRLIEQLTKQMMNYLGIPPGQNDGAPPS